MHEDQNGTWVDPFADDAAESSWSVEPIDGAALEAALEAPANVPDAPGEGFAIDAADRPLEGGENPAFGTVRWRTLVCGDMSPSSGLVLGVAEFGPGGTLELHRHAPAEVYFGLDGAGIVTIEGVAHEIRPGVAVYVPPEAEHGVVASADGLRFAYSFPTARFAEVDYRFTHA
ncbi:MAG: cupin domain-containing protein [Pseudomonadota bacterium]